MGLLRVPGLLICLHLRLQLHEVFRTELSGDGLCREPTIGCRPDAGSRHMRESPYRGRAASLIPMDAHILTERPPGSNEARQRQRYDSTMTRRALGACVLVAAFFTGGASASGPRDLIPRFSLSVTAATTNDRVALQLAQAPRLAAREIRLYLVPASVGASVRSRFDSRLSFIGSIEASRRAHLVFSVPPLESGRYVLAYWCRDCAPRGRGIGIQASPTLRVTASADDDCAMTKPNGNTPVAGARWSGFRWHGNGELWAYVRSDGVVVANSLGGYKMLWVASQGVSGPLRIQYRLLDPPSQPVTARTGRLTGYDRPNATMSQMAFSPGCWQITGRLRDASLSFVVRVVLAES